jgi:hypothetical protein
MPPAFPKARGQFLQDGGIAEGVLPSLTCRKAFLEPQMYETILVNTPAGQQSTDVSDSVQKGITT